jgi:hypothetical protein
MAHFGNVIHWLGCFVAAVLFVIGFVDYRLGQGFGGFASWAALAAITWFLGYSVRYVLGSR